ncbi:chemotaxis protein CheW [Amphibacillus indicireducens]|uniref:Chemotaxis protein CheW n=1 Tax=Amphibacillus indicireducens TaxID=1076330 RepID=A0ABP7V633_9BACI
MAKVESEFVKSIIFQLNNEEYAMPVDLVGSIERMLPITRVPGTPDFIKGVLNLRGVVTPLLDLRIRFGFEPKDYSDETRTIIIQHDNMDVGLIVDAAHDVIDIPKASIEPTPEAVGSVHIDYIDGVAKYDERLFILLNIDKILSKELLEQETTARKEKLVQ